MTQDTVTATEHYKRLLAEHYSWMSGEFAAKVAQQRALLERLGVRADAFDPGSGQALDLGCGSGFQTLALAERGFSVVAIDSSATLLEELREHTAATITDGTIRAGAVITVEHDLSDLAGCASLPASVEVAVCMGDTLSHLPSKAAVAEMFAQVTKRLAPGGLFVVGYRDLSVAAEGLNRFIPVRSDDGRVMTCFLDFREDEPDSVTVTDLIHVRGDAGWTLSKSSYRKLRLAVEWVKAELARCGLKLEREESVMGMAVLVARR